MLNSFTTRFNQFLKLCPLLILSLLFLVLTSTSSNSKGSYKQSSIIKLVIKGADKVGIPRSLALAVAHAESNFNPFAESHKGARGVMQIMPTTSKKEYLIHPDLLWNPELNIIIGLHYLKRLLKRYRGRSDLALSFYNGGSAVDRRGKAPPRVIPHTRKYVIKVTRLRSEYQRRLRSGRPNFITLIH